MLQTKLFKKNSLVKRKLRKNIFVAGKSLLLHCHVFYRADILLPKNKFWSKDSYIEMK